MEDMQLLFDLWFILIDNVICMAALLVAMVLGYALSRSAWNPRPASRGKVANGRNCGP